MSTRKLTTAQTAAFMAILTAGTKVLGFVREMVLAAFYGAGEVTDAYNMAVYDILVDGTNKAILKTNETLARVQKAMNIDYFCDRSIIEEWKKIISNL